VQNMVVREISLLQKQNLQLVENLQSLAKSKLLVI
jgi:hypothetical protein